MSATPRRLPTETTIEIAGPEPLRFEDFVREGLPAAGDQRVVVADPQARYFGARLSERALLAGDGAQLGPTQFDDWSGGEELAVGLVQHIIGANPRHRRGAWPAGPGQIAAGGIRGWAWCGCGARSLFVRPQPPAGEAAG